MKFPFYVSLFLVPSVYCGPKKKVNDKKRSPPKSSKASSSATETPLETLLSKNDAEINVLERELELLNRGMAILERRDHTFREISHAKAARDRKYMEDSFKRELLKQLADLESLKRQIYKTATQMLGDHNVESGLTLDAPQIRDDTADGNESSILGPHPEMDHGSELVNHRKEVEQVFRTTAELRKQRETIVEEKTRLGYELEKGLDNERIESDREKTGLTNAKNEKIEYPRAINTEESDKEASSGGNVGEGKSDDNYSALLSNSIKVEEDVKQRQQAEIDKHLQEKKELLRQKYIKQLAKYEDRLAENISTLKTRIQQEIEAEKATAIRSEDARKVDNTHSINSAITESGKSAPILPVVGSNAVIGASSDNALEEEIYAELQKKIKEISRRQEKRLEAETKRCLGEVSKVWKIGMKKIDAISRGGNHQLLSEFRNEILTEVQYAKQKFCLLYQEIKSNGDSSDDVGKTTEGVEQAVGEIGGSEKSKDGENQSTISEDPNENPGKGTSIWNYLPNVWKWKNIMMPVGGMVELSQLENIVFLFTATCLLLLILMTIIGLFVILYSVWKRQKALRAQTDRSQPVVMAF